jgi:hypothetical protein
VGAFSTFGKIGLPVICLLFSAVSLLAQVEDTRLRSEIGLKYSPVKKLGLSAMYRYDRENNLTTFRRSNFEVGADYRILDWLKVAAYYRFGTSFEEDFHRFELALQFRQKLFQDKAQISFRSSALLFTPYLNQEYLRFNDPLWVFRNKLKFQYSISKQLDVFAYSELFARSRGSESKFYRLRSGGGFSYTLNKRHEFSLAYFYQNEFNRNNARNIQAFDVGYTYEFKKKKKKKKDSGKK